jgi:hypothetical protein
MRMAGWRLGGLVLASLAAGCGGLESRVNPVSIPVSGSSVVTARFAPGGERAGQAVTFRVIDGEECGTLATTEAEMDATGRAWVTFNGSANVQDCVAVIAATAGEDTSTTRVTVGARPAAPVRLDGVTAVAVVLIASFAIDRIASGVLFLLSFWRRWSRVVHDPSDPGATHAGRKNHRLAYFVVAALLGLVALGWYGGVRLLAALGFGGVDPVLDTIVTGLLLVGGAERTGALLKDVGGGGIAASPATPPQPIEITGTLVLDEGGHTREARLASRERHDIAGV